MNRMINRRAIIPQMRREFRLCTIPAATFSDAAAMIAHHCTARPWFVLLSPRGAVLLHHPWEPIQTDMKGWLVGAYNKQAPACYIEEDLRAAFITARGSVLGNET